jgi:ComF family protein
MLPAFSLQAVRSLVNAIYPPKCGLCARLDARAVCEACSRELQSLTVASDMSLSIEFADHVGAAYRYEGRAAQAVQRLKYSRTTSLTEAMSAVIADLVERAGLAASDVVIPVPIHWRRNCYRGFNQSHLLCASLDPATVRPTLLTRKRWTRPQVGLSREERRVNLEGAFFASPLVHGLRVLLVDDVTTSGGTIRECARTLKQAGAVWVGAATFACAAVPHEPT